MLIKKQGFSLVELLVAMVAAALLALAITTVFVMPVRSMRTNREYARIRRDLSYAVRLMATDIRESSIMYDTLPAIFTGENILELRPNELRAVPIKYDRNTPDGVLTRYIDNVAQGPVILNGLTAFETDLATDTNGVVSGVILHLEMQNSDGYISIINETFVHTRN